MENTNTKNIHQAANCPSCGGKMTFNPGQNALTCEHCGHINAIETPAKAAENHLEEIDFHDFISQKADKAAKLELNAVQCKGCGAQTTLQAHVSSDDCAFCGMPLVIKNGTGCTVIKPSSVLPFKITQKDGVNSYKKWLGDLWWAPNDLTKRASQDGKLKGLYIPYWTFDSQAFARYRGERGDHYTVSESYTDSEGNRQTREVTKTRWTSVSGDIDKFFDDVLVIASKSLPVGKTNALEPWDLHSLLAYDDKYLLGFQTEIYQIPLQESLGIAQSRMEKKLRELIENEIGGDEQRIHSLNTRYDDITFKHILLPIWISAYNYNGKPYQFLINGRTGETQGERPYSWIKITLAVLAALTAIGIFIALSDR